MNERGAVALEDRMSPQDLARLRKGPVVGAIPRVHSDGRVELVPWQRATRVGSPGQENEWNARVMMQNVPVPEEMVRRMQSSLPPTIRRTPRERLRVLVERLVTDARRSQATFGYVRWPKSIEAELKLIGWKEGEPLLLERIEALAARFMEKAAHQQRISDQRKSALDWHGHYNA